MNKKILNKAISISKALNNNKQNICAIITDKKDRILSIGINFYNKSHPMQKKYAIKVGNLDKIWLHAEINAITKVPYGKKPYAIYVARCGADDKPRLAKPCTICELAIKASGIQKIFYTK